MQKGRHHWWFDVRKSGSERNAPRPKSSVPQRQDPAGSDRYGAVWKEGRVAQALLKPWFWKGWTGEGKSQIDFMIKDECILLDMNDNVVGKSSCESSS